MAEEALKGVALAYRMLGDVEERELNGRPALVLYRSDRPFAALLRADS